MAIPTSTFATYQAVGNREDLSDMIYRIDPTDTPFMSAAEKEKATAVNHEWQTQALAAASSANAQLEGDDPTTTTTTPTVRLGNLCEISYKVARVSGTQQAVDHAGRDNELAYQEMLKGLELKRDIETILVGTNQSAFTEARLKSVLSSIWTNGGKPGTIMTGAFNKQVFSTFTGRATAIEEAKSKKIVASVDAYESDFGKLKVVANRFQRSRDVLVLEMDKWAVAYLNGRNMISIPLAKTGDSDRSQILAEYALVARNEKSSGGVFDNTAS
jgi:hypothetical protein